MALGFLKINTTDYLLINASGDRLIINFGAQIVQSDIVVTKQTEATILVTKVNASTVVV